MFRAAIYVYIDDNAHVLKKLDEFPTTLQERSTHIITPIFTPVSRYRQIVWAPEPSPQNLAFSSLCEEKAKCIHTEAARGCQRLPEAARGCFFISKSTCLEAAWGCQRLPEAARD